MNSILVVDDDKNTIEALRRSLERLKYKVFTAFNGDAAIEQYKALRPDLVIMDIVMPEKEGIETINVIKQVDENAKIIAISGGGCFGSDNYLDTAMKLGAMDCLSKPFNLQDLSAKIAEALAQ